MQITPNPNQFSWDNFTQKHPGGSFLESWGWGDFQTNLGNKIWRFQVQENDQILGQGLIIKLALGFGKHILYSPHPLFINKRLTASQQEEALKLSLEKLKKLKNEGILIRFDPAEQSDDKIAASLYRSLGFKKSSKHLQPRYNNVLSLATSDGKGSIISKKPSALLYHMKPKTRYNIQLAQKRGVMVRESHSTEDLKIFLKLLKTTSRRGKFRTHSANYFEKQFKILTQQNIQTLFLAEYQGKPLAGALVNIFAGKAYYAHGASSDDLRNLMATYLLHWRIITSAIEKHCTSYNLGGVHPSPNHPWAGITRFKEGFGGNTIALLPALELPLQNLWFRLYRALKP